MVLRILCLLSIFFFFERERKRREEAIIQYLILWTLFRISVVTSDYSAPPSVVQTTSLTRALAGGLSTEMQGIATRALKWNQIFWMWPHNMLYLPFLTFPSGFFMTCNCKNLLSQQPFIRTNTLLSLSVMLITSYSNYC